MTEDSFTDHDDSVDYLLDPELWCDQLPRPFKTVDSVLQCFLEDVWSVIEAREVARRAEESRVNIPPLTHPTHLPGTHGATLVR